MEAAAKDSPSLLFAVSTTQPATLAASAPRASWARPFSPMIVNAEREPEASAMASTSLLYLTTVLLMPPHRPLSLVTGRHTVLAAAAPGRAGAGAGRGASAQATATTRVRSGQRCAAARVGARVAACARAPHPAGRPAGG